MQYLVNDHLSSTSLVLNAASIKVSEQRYTPWGGVRVKEVFEASGVTITKHFFAGGAYEVEVDDATPTTETTTRDYIIAGPLHPAGYDHPGGGFPAC